MSHTFSHYIYQILTTKNNVFIGNRRKYLFKPTYFNVTLCDSVRPITQNDFLNKEYLCMTVEAFWIHVHKFCHIWASPFSKTHISIFHRNSVLTTQQWRIHICFKLITIHVHIKSSLHHFVFHDLWPIWFCWMFHNCLVNSIIFEKKKKIHLTQSMCVVWFSLQLVTLNFFPFRKNSARQHHKRMCLIFLSSYTQTLIFSTEFNKSPRYKI
jgi:hypothetical protein